MRCCCGKKDITEPLLINDYVHEVLGEPGSFCGPLKNHEIRDLIDYIKNYKKLVIRMLSCYDAWDENAEKDDIPIDDEWVKENKRLKGLYLEARKKVEEKNNEMES